MSDERYDYTFAFEPRGSLYRTILKEALNYCTRFSLFVRDGVALHDSANLILHNLTPHLEGEQIVSEWPGTVLLDGSAIRRDFCLTPATTSILGQAAHGLYDWQQPSKPEDLILWRAGDCAWLVTIAHERDAYVNLTRKECSSLVRTLPELADLLVKLDG